MPEGDTVNTWNATNLNWDADAVWTNGNDALFAGAVETVTLGANPLTAGTITFNGTGEWVLAGTFDNLTANAIEVATTGGGKLSFKTAGALNHVTAINITGGTSLYVGAAFTVNSSITVQGTGNTENRGAIRIEGGGVAAGPVTLTGDTTFGTGNTGAISGNITAAGFSISRASVGTGTLTLSGALDLGAGGVTHDNGGTTNLSGASPYSGTTTLNSGTLVISGALANSPITVNSTSTINTNGFSIAIDQAIGGFAGINKTGAGTLRLNGANTYAGPTNVTAGGLGGSGSIGGSLVAASGSTVAPGASAGTFSVGGDADLNGTLAIELDGAAADKLAVAGVLDIAQTALTVTPLAGGATQPVYIIATYGSLTGSQFASVGTLPSGYSLDYAYNDGSSTKNIALVSSGGIDAYGSYELANNISGTGADADSDGDGIANGIEFVVGGVSNPALHQNDNGLLPSAKDQGTDLVFSFRLTNQAASQSPTPWKVEFDADLSGTWTTAQHGVNSTMTVVPDGANPWSIVTVTIPKSSATKLFARLRVTIP